ncbi:MAG: formate C-acetyltransferase/glycerol dehydratase family glycyl radical enzyme [Lachnospiraceae bacterium]|nr:formate C-acetyltransferase/glycerol dehydratase family glycyl radical enzyme [Lachnospiraceae bacterium]
MSKFHTTAAGTEPFDHVYCLGYQVNHEDWSPYPRVNRLRQKFLDGKYWIDIERARLVTEAYKAHPTAPRKLQVAYAFEHVLKNCTLYVYDDDLLVGEIAAPAKAAPLYPEFSVDWILKEATTFAKREHDEFYFRNDDEMNEAIEICKWWKGKTVADRIEGRLDWDQIKGSEAGAKIFQTNLYHYAGTGHLVIDYAKLMAVGYNGLIEEAEKNLNNLDKLAVDFADKRDFYQAMIIELKAAVDYCERYSALCKEKADECKDETRKKELLQMAENCHQIAGGTPQTFWQAMQLCQIATSLLEVEGNGHSISYGRMDQWLYPYYKRDLDRGVTKEEMLEIIEVMYVKMNNPTKLKDWGSTAVRNGRGFGGESLTVGGVDKDGNDATNDLTMLLLEGSAHTRMMVPWMAVRMHSKTPYELQVKTIECIRAGYGHPKIFNDNSAIKAMMTKGMPIEEARDYCVVGCVEPDLPGKEYGWHDAAYVNTVKMMEMVINGGKFLGTDEQIGPDTGDLTTYKTFDEVLESVDKQFAYWTTQMISSLNIIDAAHRERKPLPYLSAFYQNAMDTGLDLTEGGAKYNGIGPQAAGLGTCADILTTIKQLVFDEKKVTGEELLQAVTDNWEGHEKLYALVNSSKVHHYGNDDDYADEMFKFMFDCYTGHVKGHPTRRGGQFNPGVYSVNANVAMGLATNATIDGRKFGEAISDNMGPVHTDGGSHDIAGPTALANSIAKVDHSKASNGTLLNVKFPQEAVAGIEGRDNLVNFVEEYIDKGAMHIQFNIMSSATMRAAQKHPENYRDMLVRVAGYSAYFVELGKPLQKDLIQRTELHF